MMLNIFANDAFNMMSLTTAINKIPYAPTRLGRLNLFTPVPIPTTKVAIEMQDGKLTFVPSAARGAPGPAKNVERRNLRDFTTVHLPQRVSVMADEVMGLRDMGEEQNLLTAQDLLGQKQAVARRDLDLTHEWQRMGAIKGKVLDADGQTVLNDYFADFGVTQTTHTMELSNTSYKVQQGIVSLKRKAEDKLGGLMPSGWLVLASATFMDALTGHPAVEEAFKYQESQQLRGDYRDLFNFGKLDWEEYRGMATTAFIPANKAYLIPLGVPDLFQTYFAPAPYMETVGTMGLPFYMKAKNLDYDTGIEWQVQSNPLHICTRPEAIVEITAT